MSVYSREQRLSNKQVGLSCVVPIYNESALVIDFVKALFTHLQRITEKIELIFVDDGSTDNSFELLSGLLGKYPLTLLKFSRNFGKEMAISAGLQYASLETVLIMDADFQHPFAMIPVFFEAWAQGIDMVYGLRVNREDDGWFKRHLTQFFYKLMNKISQADIPPNAGDFRLLDRKVVDAIKANPERSRFMKGLYSWVGFTSKGIPFEVARRVSGTSRWHFWRLVELAVTGIVAFSDVPLRFWSFIGVLLSGLSFLSILYVVVRTLICGVEVPGYATLLTAVTFFGGLQLLSIGILGEYVAKIFHEVKQRPPYIIEKILKSKL